MPKDLANQSSQGCCSNSTLHRGQLLTIWSSVALAGQFAVGLSGAGAVQAECENVQKSSIWMGGVRSVKMACQVQRKESHTLMPWCSLSSLCCLVIVCDGWLQAGQHCLVNEWLLPLFLVVTEMSHAATQPIVSAYVGHCSC